MTYTKIKTASKTEIEEVRKKVGFQLYFDKKIVPVMGDYYSGSFYVDFIAHNNKCNCPLHGEDTPSFSLRTWSDGSVTFKCFGCDKSGDIIKLHVYFMAEHYNEHISYQEAAKQLYDEFILGRLASTNLVNTKIKLESDKPTALSSVVEIAQFQMYMNKLELFLQKRELDYSSKLEFYKYMDKLNYLVNNNLLNATEARKELESVYKQL